MAAAPTWQDEYHRLEKDYDRLREEVEYALQSRIDARGIKLHSLTSRVKALASLEEKTQRKSYTSPLEQTPDVVGVRVVVLFLSDIAAVDGIVGSLFDVVNVSDTVEGADDPSTFGYMSKHFEAQIPSTLTGPRYENLPSIRFEVQVRTLLMDAWANVSHYLAYKGDSSIPPELRRDFHALSGLFYVADKHFELFFGRTETVRERAEEQLDGESPSLDLNLDTLAAFLEKRFVDREHASRAGVAELADELLRFGYDTISVLDEMLTETAERFSIRERDYPPDSIPGKRFKDVGVVRISLAEANPEYKSYRMGR